MCRGYTCASYDFQFVVVVVLVLRLVTYNCSVFYHLVGVSDVINFLDIAFGLMAIPTILSSVLLAPRVNQAARKYFAGLHKN